MEFAYMPGTFERIKHHRHWRTSTTKSDAIIRGLLKLDKDRDQLRLTKNEKLTNSQRAIWWLFVASVLGVTLFGCYQLISAFVDSPIVVSVEQVEDGLIGDDFPAVTICNIRKWLAKGKGQTNFSDTLAHILSRRNRAMPHCSWRNRAEPCDRLFDMTLTDWETYCYSFNYAYPEKYTASELFLRTTINATSSGHRLLRVPNRGMNVSSPFRVGGLGLRNGLSIIFDILREENGGNEPPGLVTVKRESLGLMVLVHHPNEFPLMSLKSLHIAPGLENNVLIRVNKMITSENVYTHPVANTKKHCFRSDERNLLYFDCYSASACRQECILNMTLENCGCRHWTTPGFPDDKVCVTDEEVQCYNDISDQLNRDDIATFSTEMRLCRCLPRCDYVSYDFSVNHALLDAVSVANRFNKTVEYARYNMAIANVYFGDSKIMVYRREVLTTISKLCSNIGGIIGSVVGWSLLSAGRLVFNAARRLARRHSTSTVVNPLPPRAIRKKRGITINQWMDGHQI